MGIAGLMRGYVVRPIEMTSGLFRVVFRYYGLRHFLRWTLG
jgi:hypothetical protein